MSEAYLDVETTGLYPGKSSLTVIGIYIIEDDGSDRVIQLVGEDCCKSKLLEQLEGIEKIYTYNGHRFDLPFVNAAIHVDLEAKIPHRDLMFDCWRCRLSGGFKAVEVSLGIERELKGVNGLEAVILWQKYKRENDEEALERLLLYNREDVVNLRKLHQKLMEHPLWATGDTIEVLHEDFIPMVSQEASQQLVSVSREYWGNLFVKIRNNPHLLRSMTPRAFEELVAELLDREGLEVKLTPPSKDGGRDILAYAQTIAGQHLYLVECKHYRPDRPVGVGIVRALYGVVTVENATAGIIVTTSSFTSGALAFRDLVKHRLELRDYSNLVQWLRGSGKFD